MSVRRLPVYILADCSSSMAGDPIESVKQGIRSLRAELLGNPSAIETAHLSVITFDSGARQVTPLTELAGFTPPELAASGTTSFGGALKLLLNCMDREVKKGTPDQKGDWKPLVFILTDGQPTDQWQGVADDLKKRRPANIVAVACGNGADTTILKQVSETVLVMKQMSPNAFSQFFKWVSDSIAQESKKTGAADAGQPFKLPPPPPQITIAP